MEDVRRKREEGRGRIFTMPRSFCSLRCFLPVVDLLSDFLDEGARRLNAGTDVGLGDFEEAVVVGLLTQGFHLRVERSLVVGKNACTDVVLVKANGCTLMRTHLMSVTDKHGANGMEQGVV